MSLYLGCPIWSYKGWLGSFYPEGTRQSDFLREYARRLTAVEGNTTFYAVPNQDKLAHWVDEMPETFRFCPKVPRAISHAGELQPHIEEARAFIQVMRKLGPRLGPMFLQLPPRYSPQFLADLGAFLKAWPADVRLAVEVRHPAWFASPHEEKLKGLLHELDKPPVQIDTRPIYSLRDNQILEGSAYKWMLELQARRPDQAILPRQAWSFTYLRFVGHPILDQNAQFIDEWADFLAGEVEKGRDAFVICHCPDVRLDPWLCRDFHQRVSARTAIPPLPWEAVEEKKKNPSLF